MKKLRFLTLIVCVLLSNNLTAHHLPGFGIDYLTEGQHYTIKTSFYGCYSALATQLIIERKGSAYFARYTKWENGYKQNVKQRKPNFIQVQKLSAQHIVTIRTWEKELGKLVAAKKGKASRINSMGSYSLAWQNKVVKHGAGELPEYQALLKGIFGDKI